MAVDTPVDTAARTARDRLVSMLVLTALFHGLVLLGVSFVPPSAERSPGGQGLEVLLVGDELPSTADNDTATYRAQRTQLGSGNSEQPTAARTPAQTAVSSGLPEAFAPAASAQQAVLASLQPRATVNYTASQPSPPEVQPPGTAEPLALAAAGTTDDPQSLRGPERENLQVSADTRADELAPYLDSWRRRIERVGTVNYPEAARNRNLSGSPVVEVVVRRDGRLLSARIQRSSGHPQLDQAALQILRLASPFEPFPPPLRAQHEQLRFAYEWQFNSGQLEGGTLALP